MDIVKLFTDLLAGLVMSVLKETVPDEILKLNFSKLYKALYDVFSNLDFFNKLTVVAVFFGLLLLVAFALRQATSDLTNSSIDNMSLATDVAKGAFCVICTPLFYNMFMDLIWLLTDDLLSIPLSGTGTSFTDIVLGLIKMLTINPLGIIITLVAAIYILFVCVKLFLRGLYATILLILEKYVGIISASYYPISSSKYAQSNSHMFLNGIIILIDLLSLRLIAFLFAQASVESNNLFSQIADTGFGLATGAIKNFMVAIVLVVVATALWIFNNRIERGFSATMGEDGSKGLKRLASGVKSLGQNASSMFK